MAAVLVPVLIALLAALVVLGLALRFSASAEGWRPVRDLRSGLRREGSGRVGVLAGARRDLAAAAEADSDGMHLLLARTGDGDGYVTTDEIAQRLGLGRR